MEIISDECVCMDCFMALAFGIDDAILGASNEWCARTFKESVGLLAQEDLGFELGSSEDGSFSWYTCMLCRGDAGMRYDVTLVSTRNKEK